MAGAQHRDAAYVVAGGTSSAGGDAQIRRSVRGRVVQLASSESRESAIRGFGRSASEDEPHVWAHTYAMRESRSRRGRLDRIRMGGLGLVLTRQVPEKPSERRLRIVFLGDDQLNAPASENLLRYRVRSVGEYIGF